MAVSNSFTNTELNSLWIKHVNNIRNNNWTHGSRCITGYKIKLLFPVSPPALMNLALLSTAPSSCVCFHTQLHSPQQGWDRQQHWGKYWFLLEVLLIFLLYNNSSHKTPVCVQTFLLHWFTFHISATIRGKIHVFQVFLPIFIRFNISIFFLIGIFN